MPDASALGVFVAAALLVLIAPGPAIAYIVARSVSQGRRAGFVSCAGIGAGGLVHVAAAALGLSGLLASSAWAFSVLKYAGAAYLVWLGVSRLREPPAATGDGLAAADSLSRVFWEGAVVNMLNPKSALFLLAFLPQFVSPDRPVAPQVLALGALFVSLALVTDGAWVLVSDRVAGWFRGRSEMLRTGRYFAGVIYVGLGLALAVSPGG